MSLNTQFVIGGLIIAGIAILAFLLLAKWGVFNPATFSVLMTVATLSVVGLLAFIYRLQMTDIVVVTVLGFVTVGAILLFFRLVRPDFYKLMFKRQGGGSDSATPLGGRAEQAHPTDGQER